jgi:hypothetical protein
VIGLLRLYGGRVYRMHLGPGLGSSPFERSMQIDYSGADACMPHRPDRSKTGRWGIGNLNPLRRAVGHATP